MTIETLPGATPDPEWDRLIANYPATYKEPAPADPMSDLPLVPEWTRSGSGWKDRGSAARLNSTRAWRRWVRRQTTEHGHASQIGRGLRRTAVWVQGIEGTQVAVAKHEARRAHHEYKAAKWAHDKRLIPGKEKDKRRTDMDKAATASTSAMAGYKKARNEARAKRALRGAAALASIAAVEGAGLYLVGAPGGILATGSALVAFALMGRRTDEGAVYNDRTAKIGDGDRMTDDMIDRGFRDAGIIRGDQAVIFRSPVIQDGKAWLVHVEVTGSVTVDDVRKKTKQLASALGIPRHQMDIRDEGREDHLSLWVSMSDPFGRAVPNPLIDTSDKVNAWRNGLPLGFDKRGSIILATISDYSLLVAGTTRSGKGMAIANILVGAMLDPRIRVRLFDGKGTGEYVGIAQSLDTFVRRNPERLLQFLKILAAELERRTEILVDLGVSKATEELLAELGGIELVIVDELATYTVKGGLNGQHAEEIVELLAQIAAVGAAVGIVLVLATQSPKVDVVPSRLRGNCAGRWAMRVESAAASNTILGDGAAGDGYDSSEIPNSKATRGRGWLTTPDTGYIEARSLFVDVENGDLRKAAKVGLELRELVGRVPGQYPDPIEDQLAVDTGISMVAGGPTGKGTAVRAEREPDILDHLIKAATASGEGNLSRAEAFTYLALMDAEFARGADETDSAYATRAGSLIKARLDELGVDVPVATVQRGTQRPRGWRLSDLADAR
ncbi:FtsK/SpoIIIE domain-containing protein [Streptomyces sp. NBC_01353]|uniref:FtsK/SpoIIIE domain-containing protein n=1 Tax=Streptomyces sp. NBC_01353 TaxID=2903835 RepID=UPI002E348C0B|nr:FtsK/SpoIIIE domain-containing protein [Streptomyces sp. NBC_01353]